MSSLDHSTNFKGEKTGYVKPTHSYYTHRNYSAALTEEQIAEGFETLYMAGYSQRQIEDALYMTWAELTAIPTITEILEK